MDARPSGFVHGIARSETPPSVMHSFHVRSRPASAAGAASRPTKAARHMTLPGAAEQLPRGVDSARGAPGAYTPKRSGSQTRPSSLGGPM